MREELDRVIRGVDEPGPQPLRLTNLSGELDLPVWQVVNIWQASAPFRRLIHNEKIVAEIAQLTATSELRVWHDRI